MTDPNEDPYGVISEQAARIQDLKQEKEDAAEQHEKDLAEVQSELDETKAKLTQWEAWGASSIRSMVDALDDVSRDRP